MKIAILGTKGIPNNYGGFEQFAELISERLSQSGHSVTVYNPSGHPYKSDEFKGVRIVRKYSPESILGATANIIYDYLCLRDALRSDFDIIYEAGYHSVAISYLLLGVRGLKKPVIITNMDGIEWRRSKWNRWVRRLIEKFESVVVRRSPHLVADNKGIQDYLRTKYQAASYYIPYGADPAHNPDESFLAEYRVEVGRYFILIARLEPENNLETILEGHKASSTEFPLLVIGSISRGYGKYLNQRYESGQIRFLGSLYDKHRLDTLRYFSLAYFHGHSVGGTNPSLLEAMACQCLILAHRNPFNASILGESAAYFSTMKDIIDFIANATHIRGAHASRFIKVNLARIEDQYNWATIARQYEDLFTKLLAR